MKWKNVRLSDKQVGILEKHAYREYGVEGTAEALRAVLATYFAERSISFPTETRKRGRPPVK